MWCFKYIGVGFGGKKEKIEVNAEAPTLQF